MSCAAIRGMVTEGANIAGSIRRERSLYKLHARDSSLSDHDERRPKRRIGLPRRFDQGQHRLAQGFGATKHWVFGKRGHHFGDEFDSGLCLDGPMRNQQRPGARIKERACET
jgi:hypothetical protein